MFGCFHLKYKTVNMVGVNGNNNVNYDSTDFDLSKIPEEQNLPKYLKEMRKLISEDSKLRCPLDDDFLSLFIRGRKYNVKWAFKTLKSYIKILSNSTEFTDTFYPSAQAKLFSVPNLLTVSKYRCNREQIVILRVEHWDTTIFDADNILNSYLLTAMHMIKSSVETNIYGFHMVFDTQGFSWNHLSYFLAPNRVRRVLSMMHNGFPARIRGFHVLNNTGLIQITYNMLKPLLKEKLKKRVMFHGQDYQDSLARALGKDALPKSWGGNIADADYVLTDFYRILLTQDNYYKDFLTGGYGYENKINFTENRQSGENIS